MKFSRLPGWILCWLLAQQLYAQPYMEERSQHRFAQTYVGLNAQVSPALGSYSLGATPNHFPTTYRPRLEIGGLHFWGKVDFNMNFPLTGPSNIAISDSEALEYRHGTDLAVKYYPWRLKHGALRPFVGFSAQFNTLQIASIPNGNREDGFILGALQSGLSFAQNGWQLNAECLWFPNSKRRFYYNREAAETLQMPPLLVSVGLRRYFDVTIQEEPHKQSGKMQKLANKLTQEKKLGTLTLGIAPSMAFFMAAPEQSGALQSLPRHKAKIHWDLGLGYLFNDARWHVGISHRSYTSNVESFGLEHAIRRRVWSAEAIHFFWDYNGFVPFIGPSISWERWATALFENDVQQRPTQRSEKLHLGIIMGWDILASPLETWVLRTNMRYYPFLNISQADGSNARVDQFEFNFIQVVLYPNRMIRNPKRALKI